MDFDEFLWRAFCVLFFALGGSLAILMLKIMWFAILGIT